MAKRYCSARAFSHNQGPFADQRLVKNGAATKLPASFGGRPSRPRRITAHRARRYSPSSTDALGVGYVRITPNRAAGRCAVKCSSLDWRHSSAQRAGAPRMWILMRRWRSCRRRLPNFMPATGGRRFHPNDCWALLLQAFFMMGSERRLMEQLNYICWSDRSSASRSTSRCGIIACSARTAIGCSTATSPVHGAQSAASWRAFVDRAFSVDGTLIEAWARPNAEVFKNC
jgi:hypothetical protein